VLPVLVGVQVIGIHMRDGSELRATGKLQALAYETIPGVRGTIYDAGGRTLAVNTARHDLAVDPTWGDFDEHAEEFYARLANVTGRTASYYRSRVNARPNGSKYVSLGRKLEETQRAVVESWDYPFVIIETGSTTTRPRLPTCSATSIPTAPEPRASNSGTTTSCKGRTAAANVAETCAGRRLRL
jgi:cell division protein FtsI (penicillin-binding protein 3)